MKKGISKKNIEIGNAISNKGTIRATMKTAINNFKKSRAAVRRSK